MRALVKQPRNVGKARGVAIVVIMRMLFVPSGARLGQRHSRTEKPRITALEPVAWEPSGNRVDPIGPTEDTPKLHGYREGPKAMIP